MSLFDPPPRGTRIADPAAAVALFAPIGREAREVLAFAYLGPGERLLAMRHTRSAFADRLDLPIRDVARDALAFDAVALVMAHNHPSGDPTPSQADRDATRALLRALDTIQVRLLDHLVLAGDRFASFRGLGLL